MESCAAPLIITTNSPWTLEGDSQAGLERNALRIVGWVLGSPERSPSSLDVVIADVE